MGRLLILCVCLFSSSLALLPHLKHYINTERVFGPGVAPEEWFVQKLDHFDGQERRTWRQRYFTNSSFWKSGGPIFVQIGGEGSISSGDVSYLEYVTYAQRYGALVFALEHRFYGKSKPLPDLSTRNLRYLSSQQALADADLFITAMKAKYNAHDSRVITFGGSYPGNLAAWFRLKYPHVTHGSIASSAPVQAELDFFQYLDVVDQSLSYITGKECDQRLQMATDVVQNFLEDQSGRAYLQKQFNLCGPIVTDKDVQTFVSDIVGNIMGTVQYDNEGNPITIQYVCNIMNNQSMTPFDAYVDISNIFLQASGQSCLDVSYASALAQVTNTTQFPSGVGNRQWTYQTCIEFGYFQTTDSAGQPFGDLVPLKYYTDLCRDGFGFNFLPDINATNAFYGGNKPHGATNIVFVNGSLDPWHALSVTSDLSDSLKAIYIMGTAHCANMLPATPNDPPGLAKAQQQISDQIGVWLSE